MRPGRQRGRGRGGFTLLELLLAMGIALVLLLGSVQLLVGMAYAENRTDRTADVAEQCALAYSQVSRDLGRLQGSEELSQLVAEEGHLAMPFLDDAGLEGGRVEYRFDPETGTLTRSLEGQGLRRFELGSEGSASFSLTSASSAGGGPMLVEVRILARDPGVGRGVELGMRGGISLLPRITRRDFAFWNGD